MTKSELIEILASKNSHLNHKDVELAVKTILEQMSQALAAGEDIGSFKVLNGYWQQRKGDQAQTVWLTSSLAQLFSNEHDPLVAGRNLALSLMGRLDCLKAPLASRTLGFVADLCRP